MKTVGFESLWCSYFYFEMVSITPCSNHTSTNWVLRISMAFLPFVYFSYSSQQIVYILFDFPQPDGHKSGKVRKSGKSRSRSRGSSRSPSRKGGKKSGKKSRSPSPSKTKRDVDLLSPDAMVNGYYIAHNAPQFLGYRGFGWDTGAKGKKKKKGKGKKKK